MLAACASRPPVSPPQGTGGGAAPRDLVSNILWGDYAGSASCQRCHKAIHEAWSASPMHHMTRAPADMAAPFDGAEFRLRKDRAVMETHGDPGHESRYVRIESAQFGAHLFRVTRVIGGHHREDFAGVEVGEIGGPALVARRTERIMPVSFMLDSRTWRYKGYSVMAPERPGLRPGGVWSKTCIFCHNTVPLFSTMLGELAGPGALPYQGEIVDRLLPPSRRFRFEVTDAAGLSRAVSDELRRLGGAGEPTAAHLVDVTRARFDARHVVEIGIGCESCHGGSRAHVQNFNIAPSYEVRSPFVRQVATPGLDAKGQRAQRLTRTCARCHQVLFSRYAFTWEGALRDRDPGGSNINSGEGRDLLLGGCANAMTCVDCHDPHAPDNRARMAAIDGPAGNRICLRCHEKYATAQALEAHAHHKADGAGGVCMNCHMPKKNMSLENGLSRYHRVGSPTDRARVEGDRPIECALCHADQTVGALLTQLEKWWAKGYDRAAVVRLYGSSDARPLLSALVQGRAHEQAAALGAYRQLALPAQAGGTRTAEQLARGRALAPIIATQLLHPLPILRYYAVRALEAIFDEPSPIELYQGNDRIRDDAAAWLGKHGLAPVAAPQPAATQAPAAAPAGDDHTSD